MDERAYNRRQLKNFGMCMVGYFIMLGYAVKGGDLKRRHRAEVLTLTIAETFVAAQKASSVDEASSREGLCTMYWASHGCALPDGHPSQHHVCACGENSSGVDPELIFDV